MDRKQELRWQELIETKDFDQLSNEEKAFVLGVSSETNFRLERTVLIESRNVYKEEEPRPLMLDEKKRGAVIPLYQAAIGVAAAFVLGFLLFKSTETNIEDKKVETLAITDTVYVEKQIVDTVIQTKTEYIQVATESTKSSETEPSTKCCPSAVLSNQGSFETDLSSTTLSNKGKSAKDDETFIFVEDWVAPN